MLIKTRAGWEIPESQATPEAIFMDRRRFIAAGAGLIAGAALPEMALAQGADPTLDLYPAKRNEAYKLDRPVTDEELKLGLAFLTAPIPPDEKSELGLWPQYVQALLGANEFTYVD